MIVRRLGPDEAPLLRALRLRALADAPGAFAHSHAEISVKPAHLGGMWVAPAARGQGVGRTLADALTAWARDRGFAGIVLWVRADNEAAVALYRRLGFAATGSRGRLPTDDRLEIIEMRLPLSTATP